MVEHQLPKLRVASSNLVFRSNSRKMARYLITIFLVLSITTLCQGQKRQISPQYPGGVSELKKDLYYNLKRSSGKTSTAHPVSFRLNFSVDKRGKAFNAQISGIENPDLEKRVAKAVKKLSRFKPGIANGKKIRCDMSIEIELKK